MAAEWFGGAFLGAAVGELSKVIKDVTEKTVEFKPNLERLESTLKEIMPKAMDRSEDEIKGLVEILKNGEILVRKCGTDTLVEVKNIMTKIDILGGRNGGIHQQPNGSSGSCGVPGAPAVTVGLDVPLKESKMMMSLKDGDPMIVLSAPGGCGKTTLAKKLCEDTEIKDGGGIAKVAGAVNGVRFRETAARSESCSFTTSNDDDSSSTTTEPKLPSISPNGRFKRNITSWEKGNLLGLGSFGSVYEAFAKDGFFFAVKEVSLIDPGSQAKQRIDHLEHEITLLSQFKHENIVQYYGTYKDQSKLYIFLEFAAKGSLMSLYQMYQLRDSQVSKYTRQILCGLKYLHDKNIVHRDIKCANILVDVNGSVKLADFGLAKATEFNDVKSCQGTPFWMAPEVVNHHNQGYGLPADIWSLGCTVLEMLTRQIPYSHLECMQALYRIGKGELPPIPDTLSRDAQDFILQCLQANPNNRPAASELLDHPYVKQLLPISSGSAASPCNSVIQI